MTESDQTLFSGVSHSRTADEVVQQIELLILDGVLRDGDRLPGERELAQSLEVSRPILRDALKELETRGLLISLHGGGTFVADIIGQVFSKPITDLISRHARALGEAMAILAEVGEHGGLAVLQLAIAEACGIEGGAGFGDFGTIRAKFEADARDQRTRRDEAVAEGMDRHVATEAFRQRPVPEPGRKLGMAFPAQGALPPGERMIASVFLRRGDAAGAGQF